MRRIRFGGLTNSASGATIESKRPWEACAALYNERNAADHSKGWNHRRELAETASTGGPESPPVGAGVRGDAAGGNGQTNLRGAMNGKEDGFSIEGVKLLKDWSIWMVTVESGVMALVGSLYLKGGGELPWWGRMLAVCFGLSIVSAAEVLSALPWVVLRRGEPGFENFYEAPISPVPIRRHVKVWMVAVAQHIFFCAGLTAMVLGMTGIF